MEWGKKYVEVYLFAGSVCVCGGDLAAVLIINNIDVNYRII